MSWYEKQAYELKLFTFIDSLNSDLLVVTCIISKAFWQLIF